MNQQTYGYSPLVILPGILLRIRIPAYTRPC